MNKYEQFYINGEWVNPVNKLKTLDVINPATEDVIGTIAMGDSDDVDTDAEEYENASDDDDASDGDHDDTNGLRS